MSEDEIFIFLVAIGICVWFFIKWYRYIFNASSLKYLKKSKFSLGVLPLVCGIVILIALILWAAPDVVDIYIIFYIVLGYTFIFLGLLLMFVLLDLSWIDDVLNHNNKAALFAICSGVLGFTLIYSGSNVGDGPGWWCVVFTCMLGIVAWSFLAFIINLSTRISYRVTVERNIGAGIRLGLYLIAGGLILGRACAGDWTSFSATFTDFLNCWPILPLTAFVIIIERLFNFKKENGGGAIVSLGVGALYIGIAIISLIFMPEININLLR